MPRKKLFDDFMPDDEDEVEIEFVVEDVPEEEEVAPVEEHPEEKEVEVFVKMPKVHKVYDEMAIRCLLKQSFKRLRGVFRSALFTGEDIEECNRAFVVSLIVDSIASGGLLYAPREYPYIGLFDKLLQRKDSEEGGFYTTFRKP